MSGFNGTNGWNGNTGPAPVGGDASNAATTLGPKGDGLNLAGSRGGFAYGPQAGSQGTKVPSYGGYSGGANDASNYYGGLAGAARGTAAPPIGNQANTNQDQSQYADAQAQQQSALGILQDTANGGQTAADRGFQSNLQTAIGGQHAAAMSARGGGPGLAAAQRNYGMQSAQMNGMGQQQAQILHAQQQQQAQQALMQGQLAVGGQQLGAQGQFYGQGLSAAQLQQNQTGINDAGSIGLQGLAFGAQNGQLGADVSRYGADRTSDTAADARKAAAQAGLMGGVAGGIAGGASAFMPNAGKP